MGGLDIPKWATLSCGCKPMFPCTNNIAEYEACIVGLQAAIGMEVSKAKVFGDSALIILQTVGEWETRDAKLVPYHDYLEELVEEFQDISFEYLPRIRNQFADALATLSSMLQVTKGLEVEPLKIEVLTRQAHCMNITEEPDGKPWYYDIMKYIQKQEFPKESTPSDRKYLMKMASRFFVGGENLYKRSYNSVSLRMVRRPVRLGIPTKMTVSETLLYLASIDKYYQMVTTTVWVDEGLNELIPYKY
ncbi:uncharacterized protein LOC120292918 [Eucalyptus grandis]|uniref:uncharacterized protein LOC120292918 n=1 Tax=Eucalyptus grandis TaxID=71139 RepID=UPI00192EAECD|nr:uncharacterized protein LOC120292918 [Eucalyptus grandis]